MKTKKYFGTDGIRGVVGRHPITADFVLKLGWAAGHVLAEKSGGSIMIGKDTRNSGYLFESALEAGLGSAGGGVLLLGPLSRAPGFPLSRTFFGLVGSCGVALASACYGESLWIFSLVGP